MSDRETQEMYSACSAFPTAAQTEHASVTNSAPITDQQVICMQEKAHDRNELPNAVAGKKFERDERDLYCRCSTH